MNRLLLGALLTVCTAGCSSDPLPVAPTPVVVQPAATSFDTIAYQVIGSAGVGNGIITYATPTGVVQLVQNLNQPYFSGPIAGYGEFHAMSPSITVLAYGCVRAQVLINARVVAEQTGCGQPVTLNATAPLR